MSTLKIVRSNSDNPDFIELVRLLDAHLAKIDGEDHAFYGQFNKTDKIKHVVVAYDQDKPVGCGAIREYSPGTMEVKRMYTLPDSRGRGVASRVLAELETWTAELSYSKCILDTGKRQPEAIILYDRRGYTRIPNYGHLIGIDNSICFEKELVTGITWHGA
jgi:putative acetyltransferase